MYSKYSKNYQFNEDFEKVISNFTKAILFYKPKDIIDFAINYFTSLEKKVPLEEILNNKKYSHLDKSESTLQNEENASEEENIDINDNDSNSYNNIENSNDEPKIKIPLTKEFEELIEAKDIENKAKNKIVNNDLNKEILENNSDRNKVKEFISDLFKI